MNNINKFLKMKDAITQKIYSSIEENGGAKGISSSSDADPLTTAEMMYCLGSNGLLYPEQMISWLEHSQDKGGKWSSYTEDAWEVSITSWVILALSQANRKTSPAVSKAVNWLLSKQGSDGGFQQSDNIDIENTYATSYACLSLYTLDPKKYCDVITAGIKWLIKVQNPDGGFGLQPNEVSEASLTAYVAHFIGTVSKEFYDVNNVKKKMMSFLISAQRPSGAWSAWFECEDSIEGTAFSAFSLLSLSCNNLEVYEKACSFLCNKLNFRQLDNWISSSLLFLNTSLNMLIEGPLA